MLKNFSRSNRIGYGCLIFLVISCLGLVILRQAYIHYEITTARANPSVLTSIFMRAMKGNNENLAKELVSPKAWSQIDQWIEAHEPVGSCRNLGYTFLKMGSTGSGSATSDPDDPTARLYTNSIHEPCPNSVEPNRWYCLTIFDIRAQYQEDTDIWIITEWGKVDEQWLSLGCG